MILVNFINCVCVFIEIGSVCGWAPLIEPPIYHYLITEITIITRLESFAFHSSKNILFIFLIKPVRSELHQRRIIYASLKSLAHQEFTKKKGDKNNWAAILINLSLVPLPI